MGTAPSVGVNLEDIVPAEEADALSRKNKILLRKKILAEGEHADNMVWRVAVALDKDPVADWWTIHRSREAFSAARDSFLKRAGIDLVSSLRIYEDYGLGRLEDIKWPNTFQHFEAGREVNEQCLAMNTSDLRRLIRTLRWFANGEHPQNNDVRYVGIESTHCGPIAAALDYHLDRLEQQQQQKQAEPQPETENDETQ